LCATETLAQEFSHIEHAVAMLTFMHNNPIFQLEAPSTDVIAFLKHAEHANLNSPDISENDKGESWGHHQQVGSSSLLAWMVQCPVTLV
jgi:hypothetical protein